METMKTWAAYILILFGSAFAIDEVIDGIPEGGEQLGDLITRTPESNCGNEDEYNDSLLIVNKIRPFADYQQVFADTVHIFFATNATVPLISATSMDCILATASLGFEACMYNGSYYALKLNHRFLECQNGSTAIYVRKDFLNAQATIVTFAEAPQKMYTDKEAFYGLVRLNMLSAFVGKTYATGPYYRLLRNQDFKLFGTYFFVALADGSFRYGHVSNLDFETCLNDGAYGVPVYTNGHYVNWDLSYIYPIYFVDACGSTISLENTSAWLFLSHAGWGCRYYPNDGDDQCTVTFTSKKQKKLEFFFYLASPPNNTCSGFNMAIYTSSDTNAQPVNIDACGNGDVHRIGPSNIFIMSLHISPMVTTFGFKKIFLDHYPATA